MNDAVTAVMNEISSRGDWRHVRDLYAQLSAGIRDSAGASDAPTLNAELAEALARTFANYEGSEEAFIPDLRKLFASIDDMSDRNEIDQFRFLYKDTRLDSIEIYSPRSQLRRRPKPFEAAVETVRRIIDLNAVRDALEGMPTTAILGGSLSYGRFFSTCGGQGKPSDVDLLIVLAGSGSLTDVVQALARLPFADERSGGSMIDRVPDYDECAAAVPGVHHVFQHKLRLWENPPSDYLVRYQVPSGHYNLALHIMSTHAFEFLTMRDLPVLDAMAETGPRYLVEFRDDAPAARTEEHLGFSGQNLRMPLEWNRVKGGYACRRFAAGVVDDRFYPGVHLNLVLPRYEVRWESHQARIRLSLLAMRWKLLARLHEERTQFGGLQAISSSHIRHGVFSPHVLARVDAP